MSAEYRDGIVREFDYERGIGWIAPMDGSDLVAIRVHISDVERSSLPALLEGQVVSFEEIIVNGRARAVNLVIR